MGMVRKFMYIIEIYMLIIQLTLTVSPFDVVQRHDYIHKHVIKNV